MLELFLGPITGLVGSVVTGVASYFEMEQKIKMKKIDQAHELLLLDKQMAIRGIEIENERAIAELDADVAARQGSYDHAASITGDTYQWVTAILKLTRPVLTLVLAGASVWIASTIENPDPQKELAKQVLYLAGVAVGWWFGDRRKTAK